LFNLKTATRGLGLQDGTYAGLIARTQSLSFYPGDPQGLDQLNCGRLPDFGGGHIWQYLLLYVFSCLGKF